MDLVCVFVRASYNISRKLNAMRLALHYRLADSLYGLHRRRASVEAFVCKQRYRKNG